MVKGKEIDDSSSITVGTFEEPHRHVFSIKDLSAATVVLYPDQAEITRDIENIQLKPGVNEIAIKDLTGHCQEHSIKVEGKGDAIITDMVVEHVNSSRSLWNNTASQKRVHPGMPTLSDDETESEASESESEEEDPEEDPEFAEVRKIEEEMLELRSQANDAVEQLKNAESQLQAMERYGSTITAEVASPETMTQFLDMYQESRKILYMQHKKAKAAVTHLEKAYAKKEKERLKKMKGPFAAKMKLAKEKAKEKAKKDLKKREKNEQKNAEKFNRPVYRFRVKVMVETSSETEASLTLKYLVNNASWQPKYDLRLDSISKTGQIVYRAHFENKTYETWRDAKITFSSSAQTFGGLSELVPLMKPWTMSLHKGGFSHHADNTAGLYSIGEQQALAKKGVLFGNNNNNKSPFGANANRNVFQQQQQQQMQAPQRAQAQAPAAGGLFGAKPNTNNAGPMFGQAAQQPQAGLFGAPAPAPQGSFGLFGQTQQSGIGFGSTLGDTSGSSAFGTATWGEASTTGGSSTDNPPFGAAAPASAPAAGGLFGGGPPGAGGDANPEVEKVDGVDDGASTLAPSRAAMIIAESSSSESYGMTTTYEIGGLKTIKSGPLTRRQVISTIDLPNVTFTSIAVAKLRAAAFLKARFKNTSKHTFLRGTAGLTVDGSFLGQTTIPHCPTDDTISLSLGVDTGVHVSYAKPTLVSSSQGFISKENVTLYKRSIFIHNAKSQPLTLTVLDQIPVSEDERLRVNVVVPRGLKEGGEAVKTGAPGATNLDNKWGTATAVMKNTTNGEITYTVKLEKGRSCKLPLEYEVKLPAGEKIVGLT